MIVVVPALSKVASAVPPIPAIVATAGFEELQRTGPPKAPPLIDAVKERVELLSCLGFAGEMVSLLAARHNEDNVNDAAKNQTVWRRALRE